LEVWPWGVGETFRVTLYSNMPSANL
jgi:hypothetical protein